MSPRSTVNISFSTKHTYIDYILNNLSRKISPITKYTYTKIINKFGSTFRTVFWEK